LSFDGILQFIILFTSGVSEGILVAVLVGVTPAMLGLPDPATLRFKQAFDPALDRIQPPFVMTTIIAGVLALIATEQSSTATIFTILGIVGALGVTASSVGYNLRLNAQMAKWSADAPPPEFHSTLARWKAGHQVRTAFGTLAFAGFVVAAISTIG
jgi:uncharacterized membrane protein